VQHSYISYNRVVLHGTALNTIIKTSAMRMCHLKILKILHFVSWKKTWVVPTWPACISVSISGRTGLFCHWHWCCEWSMWGKLVV